MAELSGSGSPATTRPAPDFRTISAAPTSGVTTTGTPRRMASSTVLPKFSEYEDRTKSRAAANRRSLSDPTTVRGRMRTRSAIRSPAASFVSWGAKFSSSVPTIASIPAWVPANARRSRSRPFFHVSLPTNNTSGCCDVIASTSDAILPFWVNGSSIALGMTASCGSRQPKRLISVPSSCEVK
jgi:hypothetical protein